MSNDIKIKKGLNINLKGEAEKTVEQAIFSNFCVIRPEDFHSVTPKLVAKEGAIVKAGEAVFYDKTNQLIKQIEKIKKKRKINIIKSSFGNVFDKKGLYEYLKKTLEKTPNIQGIFVTTSKLFHIVPILKKLKRTDIKLVGFDLIDNNLKYLHNDGIHFLINQNPKKQGFMGIMNLFNYLVLKKNINTLQLLPLDIVIKENIQYYLEKKEEEIHIIY